MADNDQRSRSTDSGHGEATSTKSLIGRPAKSTATSSEDALIPPSSSESIATNTIDGKPSDGAGSEFNAPLTLVGH